MTDRTYDEEVAWAQGEKERLIAAFAELAGAWRPPCQRCRTKTVDVLTRDGRQLCYGCEAPERGEA
jgi:hypothetical protein